MGDLKALELRLEALLAPYRDRLEESTIYSVAMLKRQGAKKHDWFAGVQPVEGAVKLNFLPMHEHPELLDGISSALKRHKTGASVFKFTEVDEHLFGELESIVARGFESYMRGASE